MTAIRETGKINDNTTLIDCGMSGVAGTSAIFLVEAEKTCLIDTGGHAEVSRVIKTLKNLNAFPPDYAVLTHSHHDHSQGVPGLRKKAMKENKTFEVFASEKAIPLLEDQSWNKVFYPKQHYESIRAVSPLKEGDIIDLEGLTLKINHVPGHIPDHITLFDEKNNNLFVGDAIGYKLGDQVFLPPFMPPFWSQDDFFASVEKLRQINFESICLNHFGYIYEEEAKNLLDEAVNTYKQWWKIFETVEQDNKLNDVKYLIAVIMKETNLASLDFKLLKTWMKLLLGLINSGRKIARKSPLTSGDMLLPEVLGWLVTGYKISKGIADLDDFI